MAWFLRLLAGAPVPDGVRVDPSEEMPFLTLCTFIADLTGGKATLQWRNASPVELPLRHLVGLSRPWNVPPAHAPG
jgi:hypothetical protein